MRLTFSCSKLRTIGSCIGQRCGEKFDECTFRDRTRTIGSQGLAELGSGHRIVDKHGLKCGTL